MPGSQEPRLQSKMKALVKEELKHAAFFADLTGEGAILHANPDTVETVIRRMESTFRRLTSGGNSSPTDPRLPSNGRDFKHENQTYDPLVHLLNKIVDAANQSMSPSQLKGLRFHCFGKEVKGIYGSDKSLKPDGVGIIGELPMKTKELSWGGIEVVIESKRSVSEMVSQCGTYARCLLVDNLRRFFALGIGFHFTTLDVYVFIFHRSGLSSSRPLKLTTEEGFVGLVRHVVGIISIQDEPAYALDTTRTQDIFCINHRNFAIDRVLYLRGSLRGRFTVVYGLEGTCTCGF